MAFSRDERLLLTAYLLYGLGSPMVTTFSGTYVWRLFHHPSAVATFAMLFCLGLPLGFLINGYALKHTRLSRLFLLSCLLQGAVPVALTLLPHPTIGIVWIIGITLGIAGGFFWANRNYLTSRVTSTGHRFRFISVETTLTTIAAIIAPLAIGWAIDVGSGLGWYSIQTGYRLMSFVGFVFLGISGHIIARISIPDPDVTSLRVRHESDIWWKWRALEIVNGGIDGFARILPLIIILTFLGQEASVGTVQSVSSVLSALMIYVAGKRVTKNKDHVRLLLFWAAMTIGGALIFADLYSARGAIIFLAISALVGSLRWGSFATILYDIVDTEEKRHGKEMRYALLMDRESFLNAGRAATLSLFVIAFTFAPTLALRYGLLAAGILQITLIGMTVQIEKRME